MSGPVFNVPSGLGPPKKDAKKKAAPKKPPPAPMTGKFAAPPVSQVLGPVPLLPPGPPLKEPDRLAVAQAKANAQQAVAAAKAADARIVRQRQAQSFRENVVRDVSARAGLGGGFGQVGVAKPQSLMQPNASAQTGLAKSRQQLRSHGGLQSVPAALRDERNRTKLNTSTDLTFSDTHALPYTVAHGFPATRLIPESTPEPPPDSAWSAPTGEQAAERAIAAGKKQETPYFAGQGEGLAAGVGPQRVTQRPDTLSFGDMAGAAVQGIDRGIGTGMRMVNNGLGVGYEGDPFSAAISMATGHGMPEGYRRHIRGEHKAGIGGLFPTSEEEIAKTGTAGLPGVPVDLRVAAKNVIGGANRVAHTKGLSDTEAGAADGLAPQEAAALGFTPEYTKLLTQMALKRGWYEGELRGLVGMDLMTHAYTSPPPMALRVAQNFGRGVAQTGAFVTGVAALAKETATGHGQKAWGDFGSSLAQEGAGWLHHPLQSAISDPFSVIPAVGTAGKTLGLLGHLRHLGKEMPVREVRTGLRQRVMNEGELGPESPELVYTRGQRSKNFYTGSGQFLADKIASTALRVNKAHGQHFDKLVRRAVNASAHGHVTRQVAYKAAVRNLEGHLSGKKKRAEILLAYLHTGGTPEKILAFYQDKLAGPDNVLSGAEAGQAKFLTEKVIEGTKNLSKADHAFIDAARDLSAHTSLTHIELGRFRRGAMLYRQLEPLLLAAHAKAKRITDPSELTPEMEVAELLMGKGGLRERVLNPEAPNAPLDSSRVAPRRGKQTEAQRQEDAAFALHQKELEKAEAEKPKKTPPPPVASPALTSTLTSTLSDAEAKLAAHDAAAPVLKTPKAPAEPAGGSTPLHAKKLAAHEKRVKKLEEQHAAAVAEHAAARKEIVQEVKDAKGAVSTAKKADAEAKKTAKAAHDEKYAKAVAAWQKKVDTAKARMAAHAIDSNAAGSRNRTLGDAEAEQFRKVTDAEDIYKQYVANLEEFLQMHLDAGGIAPARVAYTKAPLKSARRAAARGGAKLNVKADARRMPPVVASTGGSFKGGNFLIDANSPIRESMHAQRLRVGLGVHQLMVEHVAQRVPAGYKIKKGEVAVSEANMATLAKAEAKLEPDNPVSQQEVYREEAKLRTKRHSDLEGMTITGDVTKVPSYIIPKGAWERMLDWTKPVSQDRFDRYAREYQRALISVYPGTVIGNTLGSLPLALTAGAGGRSFKMAARTTARDGSGRHLAPDYLFGKGPSGALENDSFLPGKAYMNAMRGFSIAGEDFSRVAAYWSKALPIVKKEGERIRREAEKAHDEFIGPYAPALKTIEESFDEAARDFALGKIHPEKLDAVLDHVEKFMGDTHKPNYGLGRAIASTHVVLFQNWVAHMAKLVLFTLPVKHPRRTLFLNAMAHYGDQYRQEHGAWPQWMVGFIPLFHETARIPGINKLPGGAEVQHWAHAFSLMQLSPQSTAGGLMQSLTEDKPLPDRFAGVASPPYQFGVGLTNMLRDNRGADADKKVDPYRYALNELLSWIPGERKFVPQQGMRGDSLPWDPRYKTYSDPLTHQLLSPFLAPGARADRGRWGMFERVMGFGGYQVPGLGPITSKQASSQAIYNRPDPARDAAIARRAAGRQALQPDAARAVNGP